MAGKQAKILSAGDLARILAEVGTHRYPVRGRVMVLLSVRAGLRACEIAGLTWPMVLDSGGHVGDVIALSDAVAKKGSGRCIPMHSELRRALIALLRQEGRRAGHVVCSERGSGMTAASVVNWFAMLYRVVGLYGCTSHSGRRTFITKAARKVHQVGGSLRDVQQLAGHRSIEMTQRYIDADPAAQKRLVALL